MLDLKAPSGTGILLTGSGIYWILSSQLIASFTALVPELLRGTALGSIFVLSAGVSASSFGLWIVHDDFDELAKLFSRADGWLFTVPLMLVSSDVSLTVLGLSSSYGVVELNPFVAGALQAGQATIISFIVSYMALSQGTTLLMLALGQQLFGSGDQKRFLPYSLVCGAASFVSFNNITILTGMGLPWMAFPLGTAGAAVLTTLIYSHLRRDLDYSFQLPRD